ncbi:MAG: 4-vinyl reductase [Clostridiales Family XIII bacterium]|nr:4-vinyl reductase [Clostridiales Family XIII bacterium]
MRKYEFYWDLIGDISAGRPNLGNLVDLDVYRLMQFTMRDVIEQHCGTETTDEIFYEAGKLAGAQFYARHIKPVDSLDEFVSKLQKTLLDKRIGVLRLEESVLNEGRVILTMDEDLDCSGLPELDYETCVYDEGFIAALFESYTAEKWRAEEIDCWCTGARTCRFLVTQEDLAEAGADGH